VIQELGAARKAEDFTSGWIHPGGTSIRRMVTI